MAIDTMNKFLVAVKGKEVGFLKPVPGSMSADDAMLLAAYLVTMAEMDATHKFEEVLAAVQNA
mgnify:CR=1 FL=1